MRADKDLQGAAGKVLVDSLAVRALGRSCKQGDGDFHGRSVFPPVGEMLLCEYFCRSHEGGLRTSSNDLEDADECYNGLPASYVSLEQPTHLTARFHIPVNLADHPLLRFRERKREKVVVKF